MQDAVFFSHEEYDFFVAFGDLSLCKKWYTILKKNNAPFINAVHPTAYIEQTCELGSNIMIGAFAYLNTKKIIYPAAKPYIDESDKKAVMEVLDSNH